MALNPETSNDKCFHCGLPLKGSEIKVTVFAVPQPMCCRGCEAVTQAIVDAGQSQFYRYRDQSSPQGQELVPDFLQQIKAYDHPSVQKQVVLDCGDNEKEVSLILEGIVCAACIWLNENHIRSLPGVTHCQINYSSHRAQVRWDDSQISLSDILTEITRIGYQAHPYDPQAQEQIYESQRKQLIRYLGVAGVFGMQVMLLALALYGGDWWGIDESFRQFFRWTSLLVAIPVFFYSARPFFQGALKDIKRKRAGMDVPVVLGLSIAFSSSIYHTWLGQGEVYYDSVAMFVFFLLSVRLLEWSTRKKSAQKVEDLSRLAPTLAHRIDTQGDVETIAVVDLEIADKIMVKPGEVVPTDGKLLSDKALVDEALLTGEQMPVDKLQGDMVIGGSLNLDQPIQLQVEQLGQSTVLSGLQRLVESAQGFKPGIARLADHVAAYFVSAILVLASAAGIYWWQQDPAMVLPVIVATLVVTCPCALSIATPAALSTAVSHLTRGGILISRAEVLEELPNIDILILDKTGTITTGHPSLIDQINLVEEGDYSHLQIAASLERFSEHPISRAFVEHITNEGLKVSEPENHLGKGLSGVINEQRFFIGNAEWVKSVCDIPDRQFETGEQVIYLATQGQCLAIFLLQDTLKEDALETLNYFSQQGIEVMIASGDRKDHVAHVAAELNIENYFAEQSPQQKLQLIREFQNRELKVAMVGDGVNDAPVLAAADLSFSLSSASQLARSNADLIIQGNQLRPIKTAFVSSARMMKIIKQNFAWAIGYNLVAVPFALAGLIAPWLAAIGMSLSSLVVLLNSLRLHRNN